MPGWVNSPIGGRRVTGMKIDVEGFERALGTGPKPVADLKDGDDLARSVFMVAGEPDGEPPAGRATFSVSR